MAASQTPYDSSNIFARILRGEVPCRAVHDDPWALAFHDISPAAPVHILVIPRGPYRDAGDFAARASAEEIVGFWRAVGAVVQAQDLERSGFRLVANTGVHGGQEVPHFHVHLLGGRALGPLLAKGG